MQDSSTELLGDKPKNNFVPFFMFPVGFVNKNTSYENACGNCHRADKERVPQEVESGIEIACSGLLGSVAHGAVEEAQQ